MKNIKLIATDMDGTLLNDGRNISEENIKAIQAAMDKGIHVMVATGRDYTEAIAPLKEASLRLPLINVNGADLRKEDGEVIHQQTLTYHQFKDMKKILEEEGVYYEIYTTKGAYTDDSKRGLDVIVDLLMSTGEFGSYDQVRSLAERRFEEGAINQTTSYDNLLQDENCELFKILAFSEDHGKRDRARKRLVEAVNVDVSASGKENLEINHKEATKGNGLKIMAETYGVDLSETMVLGDNFNDVSMMEVAGLSVAMGNAEDEIKELCDEVTDKNTNDGVAKAIYRVLENKTK
ncbi:Cof-type HAD-IIB family hydrolase [Bacillus shivajii]|uniref:Cof-type HAD-IIB family hydrolase n=1 Tax=Bacillus shivajii TaxID=1983719 RepID=UPI001CF9B4B0|nr:Cof-type HAD-IIB family hydrolase [Bacillus shivajii]UCZ54673.1 Cof-type HAD-IIB family hydrolase [Bacillus shivajii]